MTRSPRGNACSLVPCVALTLSCLGGLCCAPDEYRREEVLKAIRASAREGERTALLVDRRTNTGRLALMPRCIPMGDQVWYPMPFPSYIDRVREVALDGLPLRAAVAKVAEVYGVPIRVVQDPSMRDEWFGKATVSLPRARRSLRECIVEIISVMVEIGVPSADEAISASATQTVVAEVWRDRIEIRLVGLY